MRPCSVLLALTFSVTVLSNALPADAAPPPTADAKPADAKPADAKPADAKPAPANLKEAKVHYERGTALYNDADFKLALIEFKRAYDLAPNYKILYNIGQVNLQLNNYADALTTLEKYLAEGGKEIAAKRREQVQKDLTALKARTAHITVTVRGAEGADISIDENALGAVAVSKLLVDAGSHRVAVSKEGYQPATKSLTLAGGDDVNVEVELLPVPAPKPIAGQVYYPQQTPNGTILVPEQPPKPEPSYVWVGWIVTGALAAGAVTTGLLSLSAKSDLKSELGRPTSPDALDSAHSQAQTLGIVTDVLAGAAIVAGGVTLYLTLKKPKSQTGAAPMQIGMGPGSLRLGGSF